MRTVTIKRITSKSVNTKYGQKKKYGILCQTSNGEHWIDAWGGSPADSWKEGQEVTAEVKSREYQGKTYYDFVFPKGSTSTASAPSNEVLDLLDEILRNQTQIMAAINGLKQVDEIPPPSDEDFNPETDSGEVPF